MVRFFNLFTMKSYDPLFTDLSTLSSTLPSLYNATGRLADSLVKTIYLFVFFSSSTDREQIILFVPNKIEQLVYSYFASKGSSITVVRQ